MPSTSVIADSSIPCYLIPLVCVGTLLQSILLTCVGVAKGTLVLLPVAVLTIVPWLAATLINWPRSLLATFATVATTQRLGPNLRILALLLLPVPLLVWPVATAVASCLFTLGVGFLWPVWATVALGSLAEGRRLATAAVVEPVNLAKTCAVEVWKFNSLSYFLHLEELRRPYYGEPLDVSLVRLLVALFLSLLCSGISSVGVLTLGMVRLPFIIARVLGEWMGLLGKLPPKLVCLWLPLWVLGIPVVPAAVILMFMLVLLGNFLYLGPTCGVVAYIATSSRPTHRCFSWALFTALDVMYAHIYAMDEAAVRLSGLGTSSLLPVPSHRVDGRRIPYVGAAARSTQPAPATTQQPAALTTAEDRSWSTFEDLLDGTVKQVLGWGWVPRADLGDAEAYLFIGLPALALLQLLADAASVPAAWMPAPAAAAAVAGGGGDACADGGAVAGKEEIGAPAGAAVAGSGAVVGAGDKAGEEAGVGANTSGVGQGGDESGGGGGACAGVRDPAALPVLGGYVGSGQGGGRRGDSCRLEQHRATRSGQDESGLPACGGAPRDPSVDSSSEIASSEGVEAAPVAPAPAAAAQTEPTEAGGEYERRCSTASDAGSVILHDDPLYGDGCYAAPPWRSEADQSSASRLDGSRPPAADAAVATAAAAAADVASAAFGGGSAAAASSSDPRGAELAAVTEPCTAASSSDPRGAERTAGTELGRRALLEATVNGAVSLAMPPQAALALALSQPCSSPRTRCEALERDSGDSHGLMHGQDSRQPQQTAQGGAGGTVGPAAGAMTATSSAAGRGTLAAATQGEGVSGLSGGWPATCEAAMTMTPLTGPAAPPPSLRGTQSSIPADPYTAPLAPAVLEPAAPAEPTASAGPVALAAAAPPPPLAGPTAVAAAVEPPLPPPFLSVPLGHDPLPASLAHQLLEELAENVLTADIGFSSAANPLRLYRSLAALQASSLEMRYMACHTVLLGDPRVGTLVPLEVAKPAAPGHKGHTLSTGAAAAAAAAFPGAAGGGGGGHVIRPGRRSQNNTGTGFTATAGGGTCRPASGTSIPPPPGSPTPGPLVRTETPGIRLFARFSRETGSHPGTGTATAAAAGGPRGSHNGGCGDPNRHPVGALDELATEQAAATTAGLAAAPLPPCHPEGHPCHDCLRQSARTLGEPVGVADPDRATALRTPDDVRADTTTAPATVAGTSYTPSQSGATPLPPPPAPLQAGAVSPGGEPAGGGACAASVPHCNLRPQPVVAAPPVPACPPVCTTQLTVVTVAPSPARVPAALTSPSPLQPLVAGGGGHHGRWPFGKGHRRTRSQPVGVPSNAHGLFVSLVPPSPRSVPGGPGGASGAAAAAAATGGGRAPGSPAAAALGLLPHQRISEAGAAAVDGAGGPACMHAVDVDAVAAAGAADAAAGGDGGVLVLSAQRLAQLHAFTAAVQSVATALSKKPAMKDIMGRLLGKHENCVSVCGEGQAGMNPPGDG